MKRASLAVGLLLLTISTLSLMRAPSVQSAVTVIGFSAPMMFYSKGSVFDVTVFISDIPLLSPQDGVVGLQFRISWNSTVLQAISVTEELFSSTVPQTEQDNIWAIRKIVNNSAGYFEYAYTYLDLERALNGGYAPIGGSHIIAVIRFNATGVGSAQMHFSLIKCGNQYADPLVNYFYPPGSKSGLLASDISEMEFVVPGAIQVPEDYESIQAAVDAATPWTTILIGPGTYNESIVVNKPLMIIGRLGSEPVFKGGGSGIAITLLSGASGSTVAGIVITSWDQGILVNNASNCKIYNNIMSLMSSKGILLQGATAVNNQVYNNIFQQDLVAVNVASSSQNNNVSRNIISLSTTAIKIEASTNTIFANIMSKNQLGINITNSNDNVIFHNTFADNTVQVSISMSTGNVWDDGYPSGGNYWSDYAGVDLKSGLNQDQAGSDGIVDTPYTVAIGSVDRYPLVRPFNAHDVGIMDYAMSKTVVGKGYTLSIEVKILNCGVYDEHFLVAAYANASTAVAQAVTLAKSNSIILTLTWNTSGFDYGNYNVNVQTEPVLNETNTADNSLCCGTIYVGIPGDVNGDKAVDIYDAIAVSNSFMSTPGNRKWNANANINNDNMVDIYDAIVLANNYGKTA